MSFKHGEFILLKGGALNVRAADYETVIERLRSKYAEEPQYEYVIVQVVGTVDRPKTPVVHSVYGAKL